MFITIYINSTRLHNIDTVNYYILYYTYICCIELHDEFLGGFTYNTICEKT